LPQYHVIIGDRALSCIAFAGSTLGRFNRTRQNLAHKIREPVQAEIVPNRLFFLRVLKRFSLKLASGS